VNATTPSNEWATCSVVHNNSTTGEMVGIYGQGLKQHDSNNNQAGPTWGGCFEAKDNSGIMNPTTQLVGCEVDCRATGADPNNTRIGLDVVHTNTSGNGASSDECYCGVRVQNGATNAIVKKAFCVDTHCQVGLDMTDATISTSAITIPDGSAIHFDKNHTYGLSHMTSPLGYTGLTYHNNVILGDDASLTLTGVDSNNTNHSVKYTGAFKAGSGSSTLGSNRPGASGNTGPATWVEIIIDGNLYCFFVWQI
jgi:hypothetical protein